MKTKSNEKLKAEAEKCLAQSEKFQTEKAEFETTIYSKVLIDTLNIQRRVCVGVCVLYVIVMT